MFSQPCQSLPAPPWTALKGVFATLPAVCPSRNASRLPWHVSDSLPAKYQDLLCLTQFSSPARLLVVFWQVLWAFLLLVMLSRLGNFAEGSGGCVCGETCCRVDPLCQTPTVGRRLPTNQIGHDFNKYAPLTTKAVDTLRLDLTSKLRLALYRLGP